MKKRYIWAAMAAVMVLGSLVWYGCTKDTDTEEMGTIYGTVTDYSTGQPISNASVKLRPSGETTLTGNDGGYEFNDLKAGKYSLLLSKAEYADLDDDYIIDLDAGKKVRRDVQMRKQVASLQITDMAGNPIDTLDFGDEESVSVKTFNVFNNGTEKLTCTATYDCEWITNVSGLENEIPSGHTAPVTVRIDRVALADGVNTTFLYITSGNGSYELVIKASFRGAVAIITQQATEVTATSATVGGNITDDGGRPVTARGICYGTSQTPTIDGTHTEDGSGTGTFSHNITGLSSSTTYYARAYATNRNGTYYSSNIVSFTTRDGLPTVTTTNVTDINAFTAKSGGNVTNNGGFPVTARGICWNTLGSPDLSDEHTTNGSGNGTFTSNMTNLDIATTYFVRAYATNSQGTSFGEEKSFSTPNGNVTIVLSAPTNITASSVTCSANITDDGGVPIAVRGLCWATTQYPTNEGQHVDLGMGSGSFNSTITGLQPSTTYYVRAYAINGAGTFYSVQQSFTTSSGLPTITTTTVSDITANSAKSGGTISDNGGFAITARGVCWNTIGNPDLNGSHTENGTGNGTFTANITGLNPSTTYHVRAYATNSTGTVYGAEQTFTTGNGLPQVTTGSVSNITATTAVCSGNVTSDGGIAVTAKGFCWSTAQYPTVSGTHGNEGGGTGSFNGSLTNLSIGTTYYVRAYATNSTGTAYGEQISFTTSDGLPTVATTAPVLTDSTVATGGNVTSDGGFPVTARGICYGPLPYPDLTSTYSHTSNGTGTGYFSSQFSLPGGSGTFYVRAYATNANGTSYGEQYSVIQPYDTLPTFQYGGHTYRVGPRVGPYHWDDANSYCNNLTIYGYSDWRLPTRNELTQMAHIIDIVNHTGNVREHWSSTACSEDTHYGSLFYYSSSADICYGDNQYYLYCRPIRMEY